jgi:hypothetical protein
MTRHTRETPSRLFYREVAGFRGMTVFVGVWGASELLGGGFDGWWVVAAFAAMFVAIVTTRRH